MSIHDRFKEFLKKSNLRNYTVSKACGVANGTLKNIVDGRNKPSMDILLKIQEVYNVSFDWLIAGKGEMFLPSVHEQASNNGTGNDPNNPFVTGDMMLNGTSEASTFGVPFPKDRKPNPKARFSTKDFYSLIVKIKTKDLSHETICDIADQLMLMVSELEDNYANLSDKHHSLLSDMRKFVGGLSGTIGG